MGFESLKNLVKFKNYFKKFLYPAYNNFYKKVGFAQRIGFRLLSVLNKNVEENFETINSNIIEKFFQKLPISAVPKDSQIHIVIDNGYYLIGPISKERQVVAFCPATQLYVRCLKIFKIYLLTMFTYLFTL